MKPSARRLLRGMLLYALLFAAALVFLLDRLDARLAAFEASRPENVIARYLETLPDGEIDAWTADTVAALNTRLMPEAECRERLRAAVRQAECLRSGETSFVLADGDRALVRLRLEPDGEGPYGLTQYRVTASDIDFSPLCHSAQAVVPADWTVLCGGVPLGEDCVAAADIPYALLKEFYDSEELALPYLRRYDTGLLLTEPKLSFLDGEGRAAEPDEERFADNCPADEAAEMADFSELFLRRYITYASNATQNIAGNYQRLEELMVMGSTLQKRMRYAVAGLTWSSSRRDTLQEIEIRHLMKLGEGLYLCDLGYTVETVGQRGAVLTQNNLKLIASRADDGRLLMAAMSSY